jgi:hypothetical protein
MTDLSESFPFPLRTKFLLILFAGVSLSGCFSRNTHPDYPSNWTPLEQNRIGSCPSIAGLYRNIGEFGSSGVECGSTARYGFGRDHGEWNCKNELVPNLGISGQAETVEIGQPDENSLKISLRDSSGNVVATHIFSRGWTYSCDAGVLSFSETAPLGGWKMAPIWMLSLHGGGSSHTRSFIRDRDGALVMTVRESNAVITFYLVATASGTGYVRWPRAETAKSETKKEP